jgi:hypothetical protein
MGLPVLKQQALAMSSLGCKDLTTLPSPQVQVVDGVSFFIGALPKPACSYRAFELDTTSPGVSAEHNLGFGGVGEDQGYALSDNTGNTGGCVANQIDPISFSQGICSFPLEGSRAARGTNTPARSAWQVAKLPRESCRRPVRLRSRRDRQPGASARSAQDCR